MNYRVWWIPQIPGKPFFVDEVPTLAEAKRLMVILADYDLFQFHNRIKPDYSNAGGIEVFVNGEWESYDEQDECDSMELSR